VCATTKVGELVSYGVGKTEKLNHTIVFSVGYLNGAIFQASSEQK